MSTTSTGNNPNLASSNPICEATSRGPSIDLGLIQRMPNEILLKIVSFIPIDNKNQTERFKAKKAINTFIVLREAHRKTKKSEFFNDESTTKKFLESMLHYRRSFGEAPFDNFLNLNIDIVKEVFNSYIKDPDNDFLVLFRLNEKMRRIAEEVFDEANVVFTPSNIRMEIFSFETNPHNMVNRFSEDKRCFEFLMEARSGAITIETPLQEIRIYNNAGDRFDPAVWAIAEAFIVRSKATFNRISISDNYYELPKPDSDQRIRKFGREQIIQIAENDHDIIEERALGTQRLIVPTINFSWYIIKDMGNWEGYVLETAFSMHRHGNFPKIWETTLKNKKET